MSQSWVHPVGTGSARRVTLRNRNLERHQGVGTKIRLGIGENFTYIAENITQPFDC